MNEAQRTVLAVAVVALIIATVFYVPWRVQPTEEIKWAPIYRQPVSYVRSYNDAYSQEGSSRFSYDDGEVAVGILALEIVGLGVAGWIAFLFAAGLAREGDGLDSSREPPPAA